MSLCNLESRFWKISRPHLEVGTQQGYMRKGICQKERQVVVLRCRKPARIYQLAFKSHSRSHPFGLRQLQQEWTLWCISLRQLKAKIMLYEMPTSSKMKQESNGTLGAYTGINSVLFSGATSLLPFSFAKSKGILNASLCISNPPPYRLQEKVGREVCVCVNYW